MRSVGPEHRDGERFTRLVRLGVHALIRTTNPTSCNKPTYRGGHPDLRKDDVLFRAVSAVISLRGSY